MAWTTERYTNRAVQIGHYLPARTPLNLTFCHKPVLLLDPLFVSPVPAMRCYTSTVLLAWMLLILCEFNNGQVSH